MDKIFLTHLHADHMSDLTTIYCFGSAADRKSALHVYGPSRGDRLDTIYPPPSPDCTLGEGTKAFCDAFLALTKWHRNSFSFLPTGYEGDGDGYDLQPHELQYDENPGPAYSGAGADGKPVTITHFPAIHAREGAISYRLEWNGMSMVFSGDTKPNTFMLENAKGVDVLIHEIASHPAVWTTKTSGLQPGDQGYDVALALNTEVIANSHTLAAAFGYIMRETKPKLAVATHFENDPDQVAPLKRDIRCFYQGPVAFADDRLVITASTNKKGEVTFKQGPAHVPPYPWTHTLPLKGDLADPKYSGPLAQFSDFLKAAIIPIEEYRKCIG